MTRRDIVELPIYALAVWAGVSRFFEAEYEHFWDSTYLISTSITLSLVIGALLLYLIGDEHEP
jgi:hypothetical protein